MIFIGEINGRFTDLEYIGSQGPFGASGSQAGASAATQTFNQGGFGGFGGGASAANAQTFTQNAGLGGGASGASAGASAQTVDFSA